MYRTYFLGKATPLNKHCPFMKTMWIYQSTGWFKYDRDRFVCKQVAVSSGHIWTTLYMCGECIAMKFGCLFLFINAPVCFSGFYVLWCANKKYCLLFLTYNIIFLPSITMCNIPVRVHCCFQLSLTYNITYFCFKQDISNCKQVPHPSFLLSKWIGYLRT